MLGASVLGSAQSQTTMVRWPQRPFRQPGMRDPFVVPVSPARVGGGLGLAGLWTDDLVVRGIVRATGVLTAIAILGAPDGRTSYLAHVGARVADGVIIQITPTGIVVRQAVTDPLTKQTQRDVTRRVREVR